MKFGRKEVEIPKWARGLMSLMAVSGLLTGAKSYTQSLGSDHELLVL